jgi:hypothetical protein
MSTEIGLKILKDQVTSYSIRIDANETMGRLKEKVSEVSGIDVSKVQLIFAGSLLSDEKKKLSETGLRDGFTVHLLEGNAPPGPSPDMNNFDASPIVVSGSMVHVDRLPPPLPSRVRDLVDRYESLSNQRQNQVEGSSLNSTHSIDQEAFDNILNTIKENSSKALEFYNTKEEEEEEYNRQVKSIRMMFQCLEKTKYDVLRTARTIRNTEKVTVDLKTLTRQLRALSKMSLKMRVALERNSVLESVSIGGGTTRVDSSLS